MSALSTIFGQLGELSESELRQLYLAVGVRLGYDPSAPPGSKIQGSGGGGKTSKTNSPKPKQSLTSGASAKGNPKRKSQWAKHPLYIEYSRLKKVVETQAKESKLSFNSVRTGEAAAYRQAFSQWLEAKSSFRGHGESGQDRVKPGEKKAEDEESSEEEEEDGGAPSSASQAKPGAPSGQAKPVQPQTKPTGNAGKSSDAASGKAKSPPK